MTGCGDLTQHSCDPSRRPGRQAGTSSDDDRRWEHISRKCVTRSMARGAGALLVAIAHARGSESLRSAWKGLLLIDHQLGPNSALRACCAGGVPTWRAVYAPRPCPCSAPCPFVLRGRVAGTAALLAPSDPSRPRGSGDAQRETRPRRRVRSPAAKGICRYSLARAGGRGWGASGSARVAWVGRARSVGARAMGLGRVCLRAPRCGRHFVRAQGARCRDSDAAGLVRPPTVKTGVEAQGSWKTT